MVMKALTLHQPWASVVACGVKTIETRSWRPPASFQYGDRIAIHASARKPVGLIPGKGDRPTLISSSYQDLWKPLNPEQALELPLGAVVATAALVAAKVVWEEIPESSSVVVADVPGSLFRSTVPTDPYGDFGVGRWLWFLEDIEAIDPPVKVRGYQRLWGLPDSISEIIERKPR